MAIETNQTATGRRAATLSAPRRRLEEFAVLVTLSAAFLFTLAIAFGFISR